MKFTDRLRGLANQFHVVSPFSDMTEDDIRNCERLSGITGLTWTPVNLRKEPKVPSQFPSVEGRAVSYDCYTDNYSQANAISYELRETLGDHGALSRHICTPSHPGWGSFVYISPKDFSDFSEKLGRVDSEALQSRLVAAIERGNEIHAGLVRDGYKVAESTHS